jgi:hypothetical protein
VLAFHFPEYLTTPQLRKSYNVDVMRLLMFWSLVLAGALRLFNIVRGRARWLALAAFRADRLTLALGGHKVPVNDFADDTPYIGLDWFILDLLGSTLIFVFIEKLFALRKDQPVFRPEWQTDFTTSSSTTWWSASCCSPPTCWSTSCSAGPRRTASGPGCRT